MITSSSALQPAKRSNGRTKSRTANRKAKWRRSALAAVKRLAMKREHLTSEDVLVELQKSKAQMHDLRAVGSVMLKARERRFIESAGFIRRSDPHSRSATTLWKSLLFVKAADTSSNC
jgi:hypothetical protein